MSSGFHPFNGKVSKALKIESPEDPDMAYLSYYDIRLTNGDVDCMKAGWLNDNAIAFWEEYLEHNYLSKYPKSRICLLRPTMSFMLFSTKDPFEIKTALPDFSKVTHIFLPINDNPDVTAAGGGVHWSLLLVSLIDGVALHYDSMHPHNLNEASGTLDKLKDLTGKDIKFVPVDDCPQQSNGNDCGVYVCVLMKHLLCSRLLQTRNNAKVKMSMEERDVDAARGREMMVEIVEELRKQAEESAAKSGSESPGRKHSSRSKSPPRIGEETENNDPPTENKTS